MKISCIYKIENLCNGKLYVGQTVDFRSRKGSHLSALRRGKSANIYLQRAFDKYGENNFEFSILEFCEPSELNDREMYWIEILDTYNSGYNMDKGGGGIRGYHFTDEQKAKISAANKGRIVSDVAKQHMRENHAKLKGENHPAYGIPWRERTSIEGQISMRLKMSERCKGENNPNYGKPMSDEQKQKLSESHKRRFALYGNPLKGRTRPEFSGENAVCKHSIICLNTSEVFPLIKYAAEKYKVAASSISSCCSNKIRSAGRDINGFPLYWMYYEDYNALSETEKISILERKKIEKKNYQSRAIRCLTTNETFLSMQDACKKYHVDASSLSAHCNGRKCLNGCGRHPDTKELLKWEYIN